LFSGTVKEKILNVLISQLIYKFPKQILIKIYLFSVIEPTIIPQDLVSAISNVPYGTRLNVPRSSIKNNNL